MPDQTVLLVEDNPDDVDLTLLAFKEVGFTHPIIVVHDGSQALDYLFGRGTFAGRNKADTPVLMLLDLKLPKVNGIEVLRGMRADPLLKQIVVAVLTSSNEEREKTEALKLGTNLYFRKALDFDGGVTIARQLASLIPS
ncbi:MAG: response regulator [Elusimicrobia bacterium]|nr:response regulator [Elusimicrobiota bacterium]